MRLFIPMVFAVLAAPLICSSAFSRDWKSRGGKFTVSAELIEVKDGSAILRRADGVRIAIDLDNLSAADQAHIRALQQRVAASNQRFRAIKDALAAHDPPRALQLLQQARNAETEPAAKQQLDQIEKIAERNLAFWQAYERGARTLRAGDRLTNVGGVLKVVMVDSRYIVIQSPRAYYRFTASGPAHPNVSTGPAIMIARRGLPEDGGQEILDAYLIVHDPKRDGRRLRNAGLRGGRLQSVLRQARSAAARRATAQTPVPPTEAKGSAAPPKPPEEVKVLPVPAIDAITKTTKEVRQLYAEQYRQARTPPGVAALVKMLTTEADKNTKDDPTAYFVMRFEAAWIAAGFGDINEAMKSIQPLITQFEPVPMVAHKATLIQRAADAIKKNRSAPAARAVIDTALALKSEAIQHDELDDAGKLANAALAMARMLRERALISRVTEEVKQVDRIKDARTAALQAEAKLKTAPEDPQANHQVGVYRAFVKGDWTAGLPMLAKSPVAPVAQAAQLDLKKPKTAKEQKAVGDAWWALADQPRLKDHKLRLWERAGHWYRPAAGKLSSLAKVTVEKRLKELDAQGGPGIAAANQVSLTAVQAIGQVGVDLDDGPVHRTVKIGGRTFKKSVWVQPKDYEGVAKVSYLLGKNYETLSGIVGFDPGLYGTLSASSPIIFRIEGDGRILWISPKMTPRNVLTFRIKVSRVQVLTLVAACGGSSYYARGAFGSPMLTKKAIRK